MSLLCEKNGGRTQVKICGVTNAEDALAAAAAGADAIGLVFCPPSARYIEPAAAAAICRRLPGGVSKVGLFVNAEAASIRQTLAAVDLDILQFHGAEPPAFCQGFGRPWLKAVRMPLNAAQGRLYHDLHQACADYAACCALLLDSYVKGVSGGTGVSFPWEAIPGDLNKPIILAGGLRPENVGRAIAMAKPYAVDVSSGVERRPGAKDHDRIRQFMCEVKHAQCDQG